MDPQNQSLKSPEQAQYSPSQTPSPQQSHAHRLGEQLGSMPKTQQERRLQALVNEFNASWQASSEAQGISKEQALDILREFLISEAYEPGEELPAAIWIAHKMAPTLSIHNKILVHFMPLIDKVASRLRRKLPKSIALEELASHGIDGLNGGIHNFDPCRGVRFASYVCTRIHGAILDALRQDDWLPRNVRVTSNHINNAYEELAGLLGRAPDDHALARHLEIPLAELERRREALRHARIFSLNSEKSDPSSIPFNRNPNLSVPETPLERASTMDSLRAVFHAMTLLERQVMILLYHEELTMREVGKVLGLSESRICQIHKAILKRFDDRFDEF